MTTVAGRPVDGTSQAWAPAGTRSVSRALAMLELFAQADQPLGLTEIAKKLGLPKTSALGLLRALLDSGFAAADDHGGYVLGLRSFEVGAAYPRSRTSVRVVETELRALTADLGVTAHFAVLDGEEVVYLAKHDPPGGGVRLASLLGARLPAALTAVGKAQLACHTRGASTASTVSADLGRELDVVRARGYALDEGLTLAGIQCVAAPVFDRAACCGAIGVSYVMQGGLDIALVAGAVTAAARRSSGRLRAAAAGADGEQTRL